MGTRQGTRSPTRVAVALIAAILLISFVAVEPSEIRYDLSSAHGGFIGCSTAMKEGDAVLGFSLSADALDDEF